jgi:hypothetical protein
MNGTGAMIQEEVLAKEFVNIVNRSFPKAGEAIQHCFVKVIAAPLKKMDKTVWYVGVYCPGDRLETVKRQKKQLREVALYMGLLEVVFLNATRLVRDPHSHLKESDPRFWLELQWIATEHTEYPVDPPLTSQDL